ncbi:MAG TPA: F0F1 ATP synthase subunit alpha [Patescibacteria group bacterium]|nr:F0F1 ATP synthase subunit alpha [Patescibacteria group bacterium]
MKTFTDYLNQFGEIGEIQEVSHSLGTASGLPEINYHELVLAQSGEIGQVMTLKDQKVEILFFSAQAPEIGTRVSRTGKFLEIGLDQKLLGQVVNAFAQPIMPDKPIPSSEFRSLFTLPAGIASRKRITRFLETGVSVVDLLLPLGKGQRELVLGDRKTGKTDFLLKTIETQANQGMICIYAAIGKKMLDIKKVQELFEKQGVMQHLVIVAASSNEPAGLIYLAPYTAMTIAEYFKDLGHDVLIVLDDLTTHARSYREISLLARRFPGRNSYPAEIFFTHAQLLERSGNFVSQNGKEVAITCLPVAETIEGDIVGYIQTNLMSMTDGHIYFDNDLFANGRRPAINPFLSVTRVGRQTQTSLMRDINRELTSFLLLYEKMQGYTHFGAEVTDSVLQTLRTGERIITFLNQTQEALVPTLVQQFLFTLIWAGGWEKATTSQLQADINRFIQLYTEDRKVQEQINILVAKSVSLNSLIGQVSRDMELYKNLVKTK